MITAETLRTGCALSRREQPYWGDLLREISAREREVTLVVGSGVSIDSGLPNWAALITRIVEAIADSGLRDPALADKADLLRKAEYALQLANIGEGQHAVIRKALYRGRQPVPGALADWIARLAVVLKSRVQIITTNYDNLLEQALEAQLGRPVKGVGLENKKLWATSGRLDRVLHLHGMLPYGSDEAQEPVILTESHFLLHGPRARKVIRKRLRSTLVVFVGLSLTDANLIGPLWDTRKTREPSEKAAASVYALTVISQQPGTNNIDQSRRFVLEKSRYLETKLRVRPVFFKSYSQLIQAFTELSLNCVHPEEYDRGEIAYGKRLNRILATCHTFLGYEVNSDLHDVTVSVTPPGFPKRLQQTDALGAFLAFDGLVGRQLLKIEQRLLDDRPDSAPDGSERFGLFLWLRTLERRGGGGHRYALNLVANSVYTNRETWSSGRPVEVDEHPIYPVARVIYKGQGRLQNFGSVESTPHPWRGVLATPVRLTTMEFDPTSVSDEVIVGTISLNSNRWVKRPSEGKNWTPNSLSVLADALPSEVAELQMCMELAAQEFLGYR